MCNETHNKSTTTETRTCRETISIWVNDTFEKHRVELGYPIGCQTTPYFVGGGTNDLFAKFSRLTLLFNEKGLESPEDWMEILRMFPKAYDEKPPADAGCCWFWFSINKETFMKTFKPLLERTETIQEITAQT